MNEKKGLKERILEAKLKAKWFCEDAKRWVVKNKEAILILTPVLIPGIIEITKIVARTGNVREEKRLKENYIYDRSQGHYYELRRKLKSSEWIEIEERKADGDSLGVILRDMKVLK
jgi:hypothetical protein